MYRSAGSALPVPVTPSPSASPSVYGTQQAAARCLSAVTPRDDRKVWPLPAGQKSSGNSKPQTPLPQSQPGPSATVRQMSLAGQATGVLGGQCYFHLSINMPTPLALTARPVARKNGNKPVVPLGFSPMSQLPAACTLPCAPPASAPAGSRPRSTALPGTRRTA